VIRAQASVGEQFAAWRKLQNLTAEQLAQRAGVLRQTVSRLEHGQAGVSFEVVLRVAQALGQLERLVGALDPYETDLGRARADEALPKRVRS
jgi:transcriptional regulator with XRE-family HTH domain